MSARPLKVAINGFGRIGRSILRAWMEGALQQQIEIVAINELAELSAIAHLLKYDSTHGRCPFEVAIEGNTLRVGNNHIQISHEQDLSVLPWATQQIDVVLECTGVFALLALHAEAAL